ncbi:hypothetical protein V3C99_011970 [Haemonchus contortus]|uniref:Uncharacterized protein n=1 Tax=Haemonchus contortus TaxID=6289 RepID=A0A7I4Y5A8_HAECO
MEQWTLEDLAGPLQHRGRHRGEGKTCQSSPRRHGECYQRRADGIEGGCRHADTPGHELSGHRY